MLDMTNYAAHILTPDEVTVTTWVDGHDDDLIATYSYADDYVEQLRLRGWRVLPSERLGSESDHIVAVEPVDWESIINDVTDKRDLAWNEYKEHDNAWRTIIRAAMNTTDTDKTRIAQAAEISRERAYQIRDDRR